VICKYVWLSDHLWMKSSVQNYKDLVQKKIQRLGQMCTYKCRAAGGLYTN